MSYQNTKRQNFQQKVIIKLKIIEIFPLTEDIDNILSESSLKFKETNNDKYNIYNILYMLNQTIILMPTKNANLSQIDMDLIKEDGKFLSKGILKIIENSEEQIVKFNILNKYVNIKFHYNLNFINSNEVNKTKKKEIILKNKTLKKNQKNEILNNKYEKNFINIKHKNNTNVKIIKKKKDNNDLYNNERKNNIHFNFNKSQIIFPCNLIINNKDNNENKNNYSEIWINDTKMFIKKIKNYISLRNSRNDSQKEFIKSLSVKNVNSYMDCPNKFTNSLSSRKKSLKNMNTNSSISSNDIQKNNNILNFNEISNIKKYNTGKKLNNSAINIQDGPLSKKIYKKYKSSNAINKKDINGKIINNNKIRKEVKCELFNNFEENIKIENNDENEFISLSNATSCKIGENEGNNNINENKNINKLYIRKKIRNLSGKKNNKNNSNENIIQKNIKNDEIDNEAIKHPLNYFESEKNNYNNISDAFTDFYQMKNDLYLLYNKKYINNIKDELLKLEIELFVEKINELMKEYHKNIIEEKMIYKFLVDTIKNYKKLYNLYICLKKKLNTIKEKNKEKNDKMNINNKDLLTIQSELSLYEMLFNNNKLEKEKNFLSKMLKNILIIILNKKYNKELIYKSEKYKNWINNNIISNENLHFKEALLEKKNVKRNIKTKFKFDK